MSFSSRNRTFGNIELKTDVGKLKATKMNYNWENCQFLR